MLACNSLYVDFTTHTLWHGPKKKTAIPLTAEEFCDLLQGKLQEEKKHQRFYQKDEYNRHSVIIDEVFVEEAVCLYSKMNFPLPIWINGGKFKDNFSILGGEFHCSLEISGGNFQSNFAISEGEFNGELKITGRDLTVTLKSLRGNLNTTSQLLEANLQAFSTLVEGNLKKTSSSAGDILRATSISAEENLKATSQSPGGISQLLVHLRGGI